MKHSEDVTPSVSSRNASHAFRNRASEVLMSLVRPRFEEISVEGGDSSIELSVRKDRALLSGVLLHGHALNVEASPVDTERTRLRFDLLAGLFAGDLVTPVMALGHFLDQTAFYVQPDARYRCYGELTVSCEIVVRDDDEPLVHRTLAEVQRLTDDLTWFFPLRLPTRLALGITSGFEIPWSDLPHGDFEAYLDAGLDAAPDQRPPGTLVWLALLLGRWEDVLQLLCEHPVELGIDTLVPLKVLALRELKRWQEAVDAAEAANIKDGRYPWGLSLSPSYMHALIESGQDIEALQILGQPVRGEPAFYDWLRGLALHRAGDRDQADKAFQRYFRLSPGDVLGSIATRKLVAE